jgi:hypothetical protein
MEPQGGTCAASLKMNVIGSITTASWPLRHALRNS